MSEIRNDEKITPTELYQMSRINPLYCESLYKSVQYLLMTLYHSTQKKNGEQFQRMLQKAEESYDEIYFQAKNESKDISNLPNDNIRYENLMLNINKIYNKYGYPGLSEMVCGLENILLKNSYIGSIYSIAPNTYFQCVGNISKNPCDKLMYEKIMSSENIILQYMLYQFLLAEKWVDMILPFLI